MKELKIILLSTIFFIAMCVVPEDLKTTGDENNINQSPDILNYLPEAHVIDINLSDSDPEEEVEFSIEAFDPDGDFLSYKWEVLDCSDSSCQINIEATDTKNYKYIASLPVRELFVGVEVSDSVNNVYHYWILKIQKRVF